MSARRRADAPIATIHAGSDGNYGAPRIHPEQQAEGAHIAREHVALLIRSVWVDG